MPETETWPELHVYGPTGKLDTLWSRLQDVSNLPGGWMHVPSKEPDTEKELGRELLFLSRSPVERDSVTVAIWRVFGFICALQEYYHGPQGRWNDELERFVQNVLHPLAEGLGLDISYGWSDEIPDAWIITDEAQDPPEVVALFADDMSEDGVAGRLQFLAVHRRLAPSDLYRLQLREETDLVHQVESVGHDVYPRLTCGDPPLVARAAKNVELREGEGVEVIVWRERTEAGDWIRRSIAMTG